MVKVLIIGSGGREHALGWKLSHNTDISTVFYAPGNGGTEENKGLNVPIDGAKKENFEKLYQFIVTEKIDMVVVGPETPLVHGIVDYLNERKYNRVFGPSRAASLLESDKFFSFDLMTRLNIPQAKSIKCYNLAQTIKAINMLSTPEGVVVKARGLTGGKGVYVCDSNKEAFEIISNFKYGREILIAERLFGQEFSVFGISNGTKVCPFDISFQDYKRSLDDDKGPNTGGMGSYGPVPTISKELIKNICDNIMTPVIQELRLTGIIYKGFIYAGMINTKNGPKVLEFNVRFGDPECQPAMMMLKNDLYELLSLALDGKNQRIQFKPGGACCIIVASKGYPGNYKKGLPIYGLDHIEYSNVKIFHAGTKKEGDVILSNGGRLLGITVYSPNNIEDARDKAYEAVSKIDISEGFSYRKDIAKTI